MLHLVGMICPYRLARPAMTVAVWTQAMEPLYEQLAQDHAGNTHLRIAKFQADLDRDFSSQQFGLKSFPTIVFLPKNSSAIIKYPSERRDSATMSLWLQSVASSV